MKFQRRHRAVGAARRAGRTHQSPTLLQAAQRRAPSTSLIQTLPVLSLHLLSSAPTRRPTQPTLDLPPKLLQELRGHSPPEEPVSSSSKVCHHCNDVHIGTVGRGVVAVRVEVQDPRLSVNTGKRGIEQRVRGQDSPPSLQCVIGTYFVKVFAETAHQLTGVQWHRRTADHLRSHHIAQVPQKCLILDPIDVPKPDSLDRRRLDGNREFFPRGLESPAEVITVDVVGGVKAEKALPKADLPRLLSL